MEGCCGFTRRGLWLGGILGAVILAAIPVTALGATRVVLAEEITATW